MSKANVSNPLLSKLISASTTKRASKITESKFLTEKDMIPTQIPGLNIAFAGSLKGGLVPGFTMIAGPSKHFKSLMMLLGMKAYLDKYPDAVAYLYDSEFGTPLNYFDSLGIDTDRVVHDPITDVEELKQSISQVLQAIERGDKVFIGIDSIGNLASKKEVDDALDGKTVADMTRAKQLKSLFRIITPHLTIKDIPLVAVNHTYKEIGLFPKDIVGGGTGSYYSADNIWIIGRQQDKKGTEIQGWHFVINIEKSRYVREKSKIPITVTYDKGLYKWSALLDIAMDGGFIVKPKNGWYAKADPETGEILSDKNYREAETGPILEELVNDPAFNSFVEKKYRLGSGSIISEDGIEEVSEEEETDDE